MVGQRFCDRGCCIVLSVLCLLLSSWLTSLASLIIIIKNNRIIPELPDFSLVSASTTLQNMYESNYQVTMDLNVSFMVSNTNKHAIVYQDMKVLAFQYKKKLPVGISVSATNFEQPGKSWSVEWFRLLNITTAIDAWIDDRGNPVYGKSGKSIGLHFVLRGDALYKGKVTNWSKQKIPIEVVCNKVNIVFSSNATRAIAFGQTMYRNQVMGCCYAHGQWGTDKVFVDHLEITAIAVFVPFTVFFLLILLSLVL